VVEKIKEELERVPISKATDLLELVNLIQSLADVSVIFINDFL